MKRTPQLIVAMVCGLLGVTVWTRASTFTVTSSAGSGSGSLRDAIVAANTTPGPDTIAFSIAGEGPHTIALVTNLPQIIDSVLIDGYTQPQSSANTSATNHDADIRLSLNGTGISSSGIGISIATSNTTIRGLAIGGFSQYGIELVGDHCRFNTIEGCRIGLNSSGTSAISNSWGVMCWQNAANNTIGGNKLADANLISGNSAGIYILSKGHNAISGNYMGPDAGLSSSLSAESIGVYIGHESMSNTLGGYSTSNRNVICGNLTGIELHGNAGGNRIMGNLIGVKPDGITPLANGTGIEVSSINARETNLIGIASAPPNIISGNTGFGILVGGDDCTIENCYVGTDAEGLSAVSNGLSGVALINARNIRVGNTNGPGVNVISGNGSEGVLCAGSCSSNWICGNLIGTDLSGRNALSNSGSGISVNTPNTGNQFGTATSPNIISGNSGHGITIAGSQRNFIQGNVIGADIDGKEPLSNGGNGIRITSGAWYQTIGGPSPSDGNRVFHNNSDGIVVDTSHNTIAHNTIMSNGVSGSGHGITLAETARGNTLHKNHVCGNSGAGILIEIELEGLGNTTARTNTFTDNLCDSNLAGDYSVTSRFFYSTSVTPAPVDSYHQDIGDPFAVTGELAVARQNFPTDGSGYVNMVTEVLVPSNSGTYVSYSATYPTGNIAIFTDCVLFEHVDGDWDNMPDMWEITHFGGTNAPAGGPHDDWDGDGANNREEYYAGTVPTNDASVFRIIGITGTANEIQVQWHSVTNRSYAIYSATDLISTWGDTPMTNNILGTGTNSFQYTHDSNVPVFFHIRVQGRH